MSKKYYYNFLMILIIVFVLLSARQVFGETMYVHAKGGLRVRSFCTTDSEIIGVLKDGTEVETISRAINGFEQWYGIWCNETIGYIHGDYVSALQEETEAAEESESNEVNEHNQNTESHGEYLGLWLITAYTHTGSPCANGSYPSAGYTVACNSLPFGSRIYIDGIGERVVEDRGPLGADWVDCFMDSYDECVNFGAQYRDVWLVN